MNWMQRIYIGHVIKSWFVVATFVLLSVQLQTSACGNANTDYLSLVINESIESSTHDFLQSDTDLSLFVSALRKAELLATIGEQGSILVLAPTDSALRRQGADILLEELLFDEEAGGRILESLKLHIVQDQAISAGKRDFSQSVINVKTLGGHELIFRTFSSKIIIQRDTVVTKVVKTTNGIILYTDSLLLAGSHYGKRNA